MQVVLEIVSGPHTGKKAQFRTGQIGQVGRTSWTDLPLPQDHLLSDVHFALECGYDACRVRDLKSAGGTFLNGKKVTEAVLHDGDQITAGQTTFAVRLGSDAAVLASPSSAATSAPAGPAKAPSNVPAAPVDLLQFLRSQPEPLFALLDAARDPIVLGLLYGSGDEFQSLYEGVEGEELAAFGPFLVRLPPQSRLLEMLVRSGWGVYLTCTQPFKEVRKHFRHFLRVKLPDGDEVYFRFYDPRVLRVFLTTCNSEEVKTFFGPVSCYLIEDRKPGTLLRFTAGTQGAKSTAVPLTVPDAVGAR